MCGKLGIAARNEVNIYFVGGVEDLERSAPSRQDTARAECLKVNMCLRYAAQRRLRHAVPTASSANKNTDHEGRYLYLVGEAGFGPAKSVTTDLQSAPFGRSGIPP